MISERSVRLVSEIGLLDIVSIVEMQEEVELYKSMNFSNRMDHLISELYQRKMDAKYKGLMSRAHLRYRDAAVEDIAYQNRGFSKDDIACISDPAFIKKGNNLVLRGPVGSGKTYLACAIANTVGIFRGFRVLYLRCPEFLENISILEPVMFRKYVKRLAGFQILILDEWLTNPLSQDQAAALLELLELRERGEVSSFLCTLHQTEQWPSLLGGGVLAESCIERIVYKAKFINCGKDNMRSQFNRT